MMVSIYHNATEFQGFFNGLLEHADPRNLMENLHLVNGRPTPWRRGFKQSSIDRPPRNATLLARHFLISSEYPIFVIVPLASVVTMIPLKLSKNFPRMNVHCVPECFTALTSRSSLSKRLSIG